MSDDLVMKEIEESEIPEALSLHNQAYNDQRTLDLWQWEWRGHYPDLSVFGVIKDGEKIVGTLGMMPIYMNLSGQRTLTGKCESMLLRPEYRGSDLMIRFFDFVVSRSATKGMGAVWGYTAAVKAVRRFTGVQVTDLMFDSVISLSPSVEPGSVNRSGDKLRQARKAAASRLSSNRPKVVSSGRFVIQQELAPPSSLEGLYQRLRKSMPDLIHIELDEAYLRWRITGHPFIRYQCLSIYEKETLRGYAIVNQENRQAAYLTDLTFENEDAGAELVSLILADLRKAGYLTLNYLGNLSNPYGDRVFALLREFSATETPNSSMAFSLRSLNGNYSNAFFDVARWYMCGLWTEGYTI